MRESELLGDLLDQEMIEAACVWKAIDAQLPAWFRGDLDARAILQIRLVTLASRGQRRRRGSLTTSSGRAGELELRGAWETCPPRAKREAGTAGVPSSSVGCSCRSNTRCRD